jgi:hypothetical protein
VQNEAARLGDIQQFCYLMLREAGESRKSIFRHRPTFGVRFANGLE